MTVIYLAIQLKMATVIFADYTFIKCFYVNIISYCVSKIAPADGLTFASFATKIVGQC